ncbi:MAG: M50 family metallopeptidase, partial [Propionibacteriaceae bacterium]|nr:M50 family metallopeptidase [Propionibacteriaceae bacterium]
MSDCIVPAGREPAVCEESDPPTPALQAGIEVGDEIVSFNGHQLDSWDQMSELIRLNRDGEATLEVRRDGQVITLPTVNTILNQVPDRLDPGKLVEAGFMGVSPSHELVKAGPVDTAVQMWDMTKMSAVALASFPVRVYNVAADLITGQPRDVNSPLSIVGASRIAGEIGVTETMPQPDRVATFISLLASVNLFVALLNLVPLLPLDGGHVAGALFESVRRWLAKLRGRPDPGAVDTAKMLPVAYVV